MKVLLIRHGLKNLRKGDVSLTKEGEKQAELTAKHLLKNEKVAKIVSSPLLRTKQTAQIISQALGLDISFDDKLRERKNFGDTPNQSFDDFLKEWEYCSVNREFKPNNGLSSVESGTNLQKVIEKNAMPENQTLALVTHGGIITDFLKNVLSESGVNKWKHHFPENSIRECSITTVQSNNSKFKIVEVGSVKHLSI